MDWGENDTEGSDILLCLLYHKYKCILTCYLTGKPDGFIKFTAMYRDGAYCSMLHHPNTTCFMCHITSSKFCEGVIFTLKKNHSSSTILRWWQNWRQNCVLQNCVLQKTTTKLCTTTLIIPNHCLCWIGLMENEVQKVMRAVEGLPCIKSFIAFDISSHKGLFKFY